MTDELSIEVFYQIEPTTSGYGWWIIQRTSWGGRQTGENVVQAGWCHDAREAQIQAERACMGWRQATEARGRLYAHG